MEHSPSDDETARMLFELHHRQATEQRAVIHGITEKTVGVLIVVAGWIMGVAAAPSTAHKWLVVAGVTVLAAVACLLGYLHSRSYNQNASVVARLNQYFQLHEPGRFLPQAALYPQSWRNYGRSHPVRTLWHHWLVILLMAAVCIAVTVVR